MLKSLFPISKTWDTATFILYVVVSIVVCFLCRKGAIYNSFSTSKKNYLHKVSNLYYFAAFLILVLLATLRNEYVGSDTPGYAREFSSGSLYSFNIRNLLSFNQTEPGFQMLQLVIRRFTDNFRVFFLICYSFIAAAYIFYIKYYYDEKSNYIFLEIFIFFFVSNMSGLRSALGMVFLLPSFIVLAEKKYVKSIVLTVLAACFHYTMFFNIVIIALTWIVSSPIIKKKRWVLPTAIIVALVVAYAMIGILNRFISTTKYAYYKIDVKELSLLGSIFYIVLGILLFVNYKRMIVRVEQKKKLAGILYCCISFLIAYPVIFLTGAYRIPNYYALPRLTMWSEIEKCYEKNITKNSIIIFRVLCQIIVILYLLFRFTRMAESGNFMYQI